MRGLIRLPWRRRLRCPKPILSLIRGSRDYELGADVHVLAEDRDALDARPRADGRSPAEDRVDDHGVGAHAHPLSRMHFLDDAARADDTPGPTVAVGGPKTLLYHDGVARSISSVVLCLLQVLEVARCPAESRRRLTFIQKPSRRRICSSAASVGSTSFSIEVGRMPSRSKIDGAEDVHARVDQRASEGAPVLDEAVNQARGRQHDALAVLGGSSTRVTRVPTFPCALWKSND